MVGADVYVFPWVTHRHPELWPEPDSYDPTRFAPGLEAGRHPYAYLPFGGGPRACIGRHFAMLEAVIALALIVRSFELTALGSRVPLAARLTLQPAAPVLARLEPAEPGAGRPARAAASSPSPP